MAVLKWLIVPHHPRQCLGPSANLNRPLAVKHFICRSGIVARLYCSPKIPEIQKPGPTEVKHHVDQNVLSRLGQITPAGPNLI
jgi:hypothetical protein